MKRRLKWFLAAGAAMVLIPLLVAGALAWRATRVPAWYAAALDCPQWPADRVEKQTLIPMRNWIARTSAGDLDAKPDGQKRYSIELTEAQMNALLAKWTDNLHGEIETFRVRLHDNTFSIVGHWAAQRRAVGLDLGLGHSSEDAPQLMAQSLRIGEQPLPRSWVLAEPVRRMQAIITNLLQSDKPVSIDDHDIATKHTAKLFFARAALALLQGKPVGPDLLLSPQLSLDDAVALRATQLRIERDRLIIELRMLDAPEREALAKKLGEPLSAGK